MDKVTLGPYRSINIEIKPYVVTDEEIDAEINWLLGQVVDYETVDRPAQMGDQVILDFKGSVDGEYFEGGEGEDYRLVLGSRQFIPGFEEQLVGTKAGDSINVNVTFPDEYQAPLLAGKEAIFECTVKEVKAGERKEFNDAFAQSYLASESADDYKNELRSTIAASHLKDDTDKAEKQVLERIYDMCDAEISEETIHLETKNLFAEMHNKLVAQGSTMDQYLKNVGKSLDELTADLRPTVIERLKYMMIVDAIADAEGITFSDEELDLEIEKLASQHGMEKDELKKIIAGNLESMRKNCRMDKTIKHLNNILIKYV